MQLIRGLHNLRSEHRGCVVTIGNFDGVHIGHQRIIERLNKQAKAMNLPSMLITFEPYPREFFFPDTSPPRLTRLREKLLLVKSLGIDRVLCLEFNAHLAAMDAEQFLHDILLDSLNVRYLVLGEDFRFGHDRKGDVTMLRRIGEEKSFQVAVVPGVQLDHEKISSTLIRQALKDGYMDTAQRLLGRPYSMCGRVAHGDKLGRRLGFPTANIYLHRKVSPLSGVFAVHVHGLSVKPIRGAANVGNRPTVGGGRSLLEVYLFEFDEQIYGRYVKVDFIHKLREEARYSDLDVLKQQIARDVIEVREYFSNLELQTGNMNT